MIFVVAGSREYQFDRLFETIDELISQGKIEEEVFGQIGQTKYLPKNYEYTRFLSQDEFNRYQSKADIVISHGGTGSLVGALKKGKKVIAVPRLLKYGEHIDDHQIQVSSVLANENYLIMVKDMKDLLSAINELKNNLNTVKPYDKPSFVVDVIDSFIDNL